jgi:type IV pilus assembly protein PilB
VKPSSATATPPAGVPVRTPASRAAAAVELVKGRKLSTAALSAAGFTSIDEVIDVVAKQFRLPRLELDTVALEPELANLVPRALAERHRIVPVFASAQELSLAVSDPTQIEVVDWLSRELKRTVTTVLATPSEIDRALRRLYEPKPTGSSLEVDVNVSQEALLEATPIVNGIIVGALEQRASDIHVEATERDTVVRYRVDGALRLVESRPIELHPAVVSRIKVLANLDISIRHIPQDGRIKLKHNGTDIDLRVSVLPTYWGEKVVCRVLDNKRAALPLDELGFTGQERAIFDRMISAPYGLLLVTGPTGSGKSTTLYAALNAVKSPDVNIVTVEDPVEYQIAGINQVQVNVKRGLTFSGALRSILRQDPDIVLVGEIRDHETGVIAAEAALTGHLVMSSLHTNDAVGSITRLTEMGIEPYLVAPSLVGVIAQRLMRRNCTSCSEPHRPDQSDLEALGLPDLPATVTFMRGRGCEVCQKTGYKGRIAVRELLEVTDTIRALIARGATADELRAHVDASGFRSMRFAALRLLLAGTTSAREVLRVTRG